MAKTIKIRYTGRFQRNVFGKPMVQNEVREFTEDEGSIVLKLEDMERVEGVSFPVPPQFASLDPHGHITEAVKVTPKPKRNAKPASKKKK